jgi:hypothetical protein
MFTKVHKSLSEKIFENTPVQITPDILSLCRDINGASPLFVQVKPHKGAKYGECFFNVANAIHNSGGEIMNGWAIWEWPRVFVEAEHHAIWKLGNEYIDVTPHIPETGRALFLPDQNAEFDYANRKRKMNIKRAVNNNKHVKDWIALTDSMHKLIEENSVGELVQLDQTAQLKLKRIHHESENTKLGIILWLAKTTGRNDKCFCGSGRKFKTCCSSFVC